MGTYDLSEEELRDIIICAISDAEGDFDVKTLNKAWKLAQKELHTIETTDRMLCDNCGKPFMIRKVNFKCPECGHNN